MNDTPEIPVKLLPENPKSPEKSPEQAGNIMDWIRRGERISKNSDVREAALAASRTLINAGIVAVDLLPVFGHAATAADLAKAVNWASRKLGVGVGFDLTPDVPSWISFIGMLPELPTGGAAPTHIFEALLQFKADRTRIVDGWNVAKSIAKGEYSDYSANREDLDKAAGAFGVNLAGT